MKVNWSLVRKLHAPHSVKVVQMFKVSIINFQRRELCLINALLCQTKDREVSEAQSLFPSGQYECSQDLLRTHLRFFRPHSELVTCGHILSAV